MAILVWCTVFKSDINRTVKQSDNPYYNVNFAIKPYKLNRSQVRKRLKYQTIYLFCNWTIWHYIRNCKYYIIIWVYTPKGRNFKTITNQYLFKTENKILTKLIINKVYHKTNAFCLQSCYLNLKFAIIVCKNLDSFV